MHGSSGAFRAYPSMVVHPCEAASRLGVASLPPWGPGLERDRGVGARVGRRANRGANGNPRQARAARRRRAKGLGPATADEAQKLRRVDSATPEAAGTGKKRSVAAYRPQSITVSEAASVVWRSQPQSGGASFRSLVHTVRKRNALCSSLFCHSLWPLAYPILTTIFANPFSH